MTPTSPRLFEGYLTTASDGLLCGSGQQTAQPQKAEHTHSCVLLVLGELVAYGVLKEGLSHAWFWAAQLSAESYWTLRFDLPLFSWDQNSLDFQTPCESRLGFCDASALADTVAPPWEPHTVPGVKKHNAEHLSTEQGREF